MKEYRIAFFTVDWNYDLVESTLHGLKRFVDEHENVKLCIFDCFGKDVGSTKDRSEYAIYELADLNQFDGLLIQGNQIVLQSVREEIVKCIGTQFDPEVARAMLEIIDEEVPLAEPPQTGDISMLWFAMIMMSGLGLCMLNLLEKKREEA